MFLLSLLVIFSMENQSASLSKRKLKTYKKNSSKKQKPSEFTEEFSNSCTKNSAWFEIFSFGDFWLNETYTNQDLNIYEYENCKDSLKSTLFQSRSIFRNKILDIELQKHYDHWLYFYILFLWLCAKYYLESCNSFEKMVIVFQKFRSQFGLESKRYQNIKLLFVYNLCSASKPDSDLIAYWTQNCSSIVLKHWILNEKEKMLQFDFFGKESLAKNGLSI